MPLGLIWVCCQYHTEHYRAAKKERDCGEKVRKSEL
jgi:hypothetical protein